MKKYLFTAAAMMVAMTSCVKEADVVVPQDDDKVWVEFAAGVQTKVAINDGETNTVTWEKDDKVSINGVEFAVKNESISDDKTTATFGAYVEPSFLDAENFTAVYPVEAAEWVDGAPQITVPAVQDGAADIIAVAEVAVLEDATLNFKHVVSFIKFQVPAEVKTVTISAEEVVAGKVKKVAFAEVESVTTISYEAVEGQKTVTVSLGADASFQPETVYYAAVLPGAKTNFTLTFGDKVYKTWETLNIKQGRILNVKEKADRNLAYKLSDEEVTEVAYTMGTEFTAPVLTGEMTGVVYASSNAEVATVSETGKVTIHAVGITTITASAEENNTHLTGSASYTLTVSDKAVREISFASTEVSAILGAEFIAPVLNGVEKEDVVTYSSSVETVATVDLSTGAVTLKGAGETVITATVSATATHKAATATYTLTVTKEVRTLTFSPESVEVTYAADLDVTEPTLNGLKAEETVTYESSDKTVATVDASGVVTVHKAGSTTITATLAATDNYDGATASYTLTVNKADRTVSFGENSKTVTYGDNVILPALNDVTDLDHVTYSIAEGDAATVTETTGVVELVKAGTVTIKATVAATDTHNECSATYTLTINKAARTLSFSPKTATATLGSEFTKPTLSGVNQGETVRYSSSKPSVATVTTDGTVTLVAAGETTIEATIAEDEKYLEGLAEYTLTVKKVVYLVPNKNWKDANARFAARFYNDGNDSDKWVDMTDSNSDGIYEVEVPSGYSMVIFCRMNPSTTINNWDNKWAQTGDLLIGNDLYCVIPFDVWDGISTWSKAPVYDISNKIYLNPSDNWKEANARFEAYFWGNNSDQWVTMTKISTNPVYYEAKYKDGMKNVKFLRKDPTSEAHNFSNGVWAATGDLTWGDNNFWKNIDWNTTGTWYKMK